MTRLRKLMLDELQRRNCQNCPDQRISAHPRASCRGSSDMVLTFIRTDPVMGEEPMMDECIGNS